MMSFRWCFIGGLFLTLLMSCSSYSKHDVTAEPQALSMSDVIIYTAHQIHTMNRALPTATAVAVRDNIIVGIGSNSSLQKQFADATVSTQFKQHTLVPGLIDPHMHVLLGSIMYSLPFATPWPMVQLNGDSKGYATRSQFLARLEEVVLAAPNDGSPVIIFGYHNLVQGALTRTDLDKITSARPLVVWHYSGHDFYLNSAALSLSNMTPAMHADYEGVELNSNGKLSGRIYEDAVPLLLQSLGRYLYSPQLIQRGATRYFSILKQAGITTTAEMAYGIFNRPLEDQIIASMWGSLKQGGFRLYLIPDQRAFSKEFGDKAPSTIKQMSTDLAATSAPVLPRVKYFTDAAFYSQTMRVTPPGYLAGQSKGSQGLWVMPPDEIASIITPFWQQGLSVHIHSNGDAAQTATLNALTQLRKLENNNDFVIEHGGLFSPQHVNSAAQENAMVSAASHYVYYLAEHYQQPLGPERSTWISPLGSLTKAGVSVTLHSDAPLAPPQPLRAAAVQILRSTKEGGIYQPEQALSPYDALEAVTLNAARALGLSDALGSIEVGKQADFTILEQDPLKTPAEQWVDIGIWGVVLDGEVIGLAQ